MSGSVPGPLGPLVADAAVGALLGLGAVCAVGYGGVLIAHTLGSRGNVTVRALNPQACTSTALLTHERANGVAATEQ